MQSLIPSDHQLQVLAAAVTPVVLISASAIVISGVNTRYAAVADRMRVLALEFREPNCGPLRREVIAREMSTFQIRVRLVAWAERVLYFSVMCFTSVVLMIGAELVPTIHGAALPTFIIGIVLIMVAIVLQLAELQLSARTLRLETEDIAAGSKDRRP